jgi:hypothetical protein
MEAAPVYTPEPPAAKPKMSPWLIVLLAVLAVCVALPLLAMCVIVVLALLSPAIGNIFSNIVINI